LRGRGTCGKCKIKNVNFDPAVKKIYIKKEALATPPCSGDWEFITGLLNVRIKTP
jgi:hypothetical protein